MMQAPIIVLKEGTDSSQGKPQIISNINACEAIVDAIRSTLGPRGMDKLIVDTQGRSPYRQGHICSFSTCSMACVW
jgi:T-complex protein 1 subunit eta